MHAAIKWTPMVFVLLAAAVLVLAALGLWAGGPALVPPNCPPDC